MLEKIITWSIRNKVVVAILALLAVGLGVHALFSMTVDALPDLSDVQVIVYTEYKGQSPRIIEDQVTYPLTTALVFRSRRAHGAGYSFFGYSLVYVIFEDGTDMYWARTRVLEYLSGAQARLPGGVTPVLGPDATGVGWYTNTRWFPKNVRLPNCAPCRTGTSSTSWRAFRVAEVAA